MSYASLAFGYSLLTSHSPSPPADAMTRAKEAALRALELDNDLADAHAALALITFYKEWDWEGAKREFERALTLNPNLPEAHAHYAFYLNLFGRQQEALAEMRRAQEVDPLNPLWVAWYGDLQWTVDEYDQTIEAERKALELDPNFPWAHFMMGMAYAAKGTYKEAIAAEKKAVAANPDWKWTLAYCYALSGRKEEARKIATAIQAENKPDNSFGLTIVYSAVGDKEEVFHQLETAYMHRHPFLPWLIEIPPSTLRPYREDPRFLDLARKMNLSSQPLSQISGSGHTLARKTDFPAMLHQPGTTSAEVKLSMPGSRRPCGFACVGASRL